MPVRVGGEYAAQGGLIWSDPLGILPDVDIGLSTPESMIPDWMAFTANPVTGEVEPTIRQTPEYAAVTAQQTANAVAVGAIDTQDAIQMVQDAQQSGAGAYTPGYIEGLKQGLSDQGISVPPEPALVAPVEQGIGITSPAPSSTASGRGAPGGITYQPGTTVAGPENVNTRPLPYTTVNQPIQSGSPMGTVNLQIDQNAAAPEAPAYFNKAGMPYTNELEAYWYNAADAQWYMGNRDTGAITLLAGPPWNAGGGIGLGTIALIGGALLVAKGLFK